MQKLTQRYEKWLEVNGDSVNHVSSSEMENDEKKALFGTQTY